MAELRTTTARENSFLEMIHERNISIDQLIQENEHLKQRIDILSEERQQEPTKEA